MSAENLTPETPFAKGDSAFFEKGIYFLPKKYIPFAEKLYTFLRKGTDVLPEKYVPFSKKVYIFLKNDSTFQLKR